MIKQFLLKIHFAWPTILHDFPTRQEQETELTIDRAARGKLNARLRAAEIELRNLIGSR